MGGEGDDGVVVDYSTLAKIWPSYLKVAGLLSMMGSSLIIGHIVSSKKRMGLVYHRLLLGMSISDLLSSFCIFLSTWPRPSHDDDGNRSSSFLASGTVMTCTIHGFFSQGTGIATPSYNVMLGTYVLCNSSKICWTERKMKRIEICFHSWPIMIAVGTSIADGEPGQERAPKASGNNEAQEANDDGNSSNINNHSDDAINAVLQLARITEN